jgi:putative serine protease PepD
MTENEYPAGPPNPQQPPQAAQPPDHQTAANQPVQQPTSVYPPAPADSPYQQQPYQPPFFEPQPAPAPYPPGPATYGQPLPPAESVARKGPSRAKPLVAAAAIAAVIGGGIGAGTVAIADRHGGTVNTGLKITNATGAPAAQLDGTVGAAAAKIRPSVVTINVSGGQSSGTGSGVIIRADGYILTNDHVVSLGSTSGTISVTMSDGRTTKAKIVGRDSSDDLAVIKVDGLSNLTAATFAKSSSLSVGQTVVAVGAPLGLSDTVTSGIISNLARPVRAGDNDQAVFEAVQTDAAINPGNSGGPLVDLNGSVVGINAAIATDNSGGGLQIPGQPQQQSGNIGIGFAIPADESGRIASELIATGKATHAVLGVTVGGQQTDTSVVGVPLRTVSSDGAAAKAGLKVNDVVTAVNDHQVRTSDALIAAVRSHAPGEQVKISYSRGGSAATATVTLGKSDS